MALFKVNRGNSSNLPVAMTDGWAYFCTDTAEFYIDYADENGVLHRKQINANAANKLLGYEIATDLSASSVEIPTSSAVFNAMSSKADLSYISDTYYTKTDVDSHLSQKAQVQIITWGADD